jgi:hypothetical protein
MISPESSACWLVDTKTNKTVTLSSSPAPLTETDMEATIAQAESLFSKAEDELDYITRKLEAEFAVKATQQGLDTVSLNLSEPS